MLRTLVLVFVLVNAGLWYWLRSDPQALQGDREPQRLGRQVAPDAIQVLPDLPAASAASASPATAAASAVSLTASAADVAKASEAVLDCSETPPLDDTQFTALKAALAKAGVPPEAVVERRQSQGGTWIVYLGRFADSQTWQQNADELRKLDVRFERVNSPTILAPGLSLGQFASQAEATKKLDELTKHGVHSARVVTLTAPTILRHLQVRASDPAWHHATGAQRFDSCAAQPAAKT